MINRRHITVIIPALNEESAIARVIGDLPGEVDRIIVVDNGSVDNTALRARHAGATVVTESRKGYGSACIAGIRESRDSDIIGFIDGDYSDYPEDLLTILEPIANDHCDLAIGCRRQDPNAGPALPRHQKWGNWIACRLIRLVHGFHYEDLGPMRCLCRSTLEKLQMQDGDFGWTVEMQIKASRAGARILQVPVRYRPRIGESKISGTVAGSMMAAYKIIYWTLKLAFTPKSLDIR